MMSDFRNLDDKCESQMVLLSRHTDIVMLFIYDQLVEKIIHNLPLEPFEIDHPNLCQYAIALEQKCLE